MGWCITPLVFLRYTRWMRVYSSVYYFGFVYIFAWLIFYRIYTCKCRKVAIQSEDVVENVAEDVAIQNTVTATATQNVSATPQSAKDASKAD